jgi:CHAT domain-containing protein
MLSDAQLRDDAIAQSRLAARSRGKRISVRAAAYVFSGLLLVTFVALIVLLHAHSDPKIEFSRARVLFESGHLAESQVAAAKGYQRFRSSHPDWASQFLLLEAELLIWRGMSDDSLRLLSTEPATFYNQEGIIQKLALEAVALTHLERLPEALQKLADSSARCRAAMPSVCGGVLRAQGILALEQGQLPQARDFFLKSLAFARAQHDRLMETTVLLYLGQVSSQSEHFDEELDWTRTAYRLAVDAGQGDLAQVASGGLGWSYFKLGDKERALDLFLEAQRRASELGDTVFEIRWLITTGMVYLETGKLVLARNAYQAALDLARQNHSEGDIASGLILLAQIAVAAGNPVEAEKFADQAFTLVQGWANPDDRVDILAIRLQAAALRGDKTRAEALLREVEASPESQTSMKWASERAMATLYEDRGETAAAENAYRSALRTFETARAEIQTEDSRLPFITNATRIYDDYIHFLVKQGRIDEALVAADQSRARTLAQGLGGTNAGLAARPTALRAGEIAQKTGATVLFYWLGERESYLWAITPRKTELFTLPAQARIAPLIQSYRKALLEPALWGDGPNADGIELYRVLVSPAADLIRPNDNVVVVSDGPLSLLNFETLVVPGTAPHYWIEDANVVSAPSLYLLASARPVRANNRKLLLLGDAVSPNPDYPDLPMAAAEMLQIEKHFGPDQETVYVRQAARSDAYLKSDLKNYAYIHFVAHGVASRTDPLDSAIILSRTGAAEDSFKLHAREIIQHPIDARLVTISACYGGGTRSYAGEGLVGLSWAFLRAGAHNVIGALWEASDDSTPQLMDGLYQGLEDGKSPSVALRQAKLALLHSQEKFSQPFYWAPFQIYTGL